MRDLLPCPFCDYPVPRISRVVADYDLYYVHCRMCSASGPHEPTTSEAADRWNRRTPEWRHREGPDYP